MKVEFQPNLIEDVVFLEVRRREGAGEHRVAADFRATVDPLYERGLQGDERELAFRDAHARFFRVLGFEEWFADILREFPILHREIALATFLKAVRKKEEAAELFVRPDDLEPGRPHRTAVIKVRPETVIDAERFREWLRRELLHLQDMVDPGFGYVPSLDVDPGNPARANLVRDRYRVLWDAWVDVRTGRSREKALSVDLERVFRGLQNDARIRVRNMVYGVTHMTHTSLLRLAHTGLAEEG